MKKFYLINNFTHHPLVLCLLKGKIKSQYSRVHFLKQEIKKKQTHIRAISLGIIAYPTIQGFLSAETQGNESVILWRQKIFDKCSHQLIPQINY